MTDSVETIPVVIIGAGIAGLTCARSLTDKGVSCCLIDKGYRVGGRTSTRGAASEQRFDHGAQYFTARSPEFREAVAAWRSEGVVDIWNPTIHVFSPEPEGSARDTRASNASSVERFVGTPSMVALAQHLARDLDVRTATRVDRVERTDHTWRLLGEEDRPIVDAAWIVVTAPAPQTATLLEPIAPEIAAQAEACSMQACLAVMVSFVNRLDVGFDAAFVNEGPLSWIARDSSKPGRPAGERWILHADPSHPEAGGQDFETQASAIVDEFFRLLDIPRVEPASQSVHFWRYALPLSPLPNAFLVDENTRVAACGDWCGGPASKEPSRAAGTSRGALRAILITRSRFAMIESN